MHKTSDFNFNLPEELIANQPANPRDSAKMLVWQDNKMIDRAVSHLADFLNKGDILVLNDTKVIKAKLIGKRNDAKVEINLHKQIKDNLWQVFAKPAKRLKIGDQFIIADDFSAQILDKKTNGIVELSFNKKDSDFFAMLEKYGQMPLPPYIKRNNQPLNIKKEDNINYQTIYAKNAGAVAAPTAGLHFSDQLFEKLDKKGVKKVFTTLNVGAGTFLPVKSEYVQDHQMHSEYFEIDKYACDQINQAKERGNKIIAVGTTSLRVLESAADEDGILKPQSGNTEIFIYPPYKFKIVDILMTNFHLPKSTLFMLICAFIGKENAFLLYEKAIKDKYRFYSFGDATLLF